MHKSIIQLFHALSLHVFAKTDTLIELTYNYYWVQISYTVRILIF